MILRPLVLFGIVISMVTGVAMGIIAFHWMAKGEGVDDATATFTKVLDHVQASYVEEVPADELVNKALQGMLDGLDPHSDYLDNDSYDDLQADTTGRFGGVGIELGLVEDYFTVISPIDGTPAQRAGLQPGDRVIELDSQSLQGKKLIDVVKVMRGEPGTAVTMMISRATGEEPFEVKLKRAVIEINSVSQRMLEPGYGYIRISQFQTSTATDFKRGFEKLEDDNGDELSGLVLDLRNNPGGVLQASVTIADSFLEDGLIVYTQGRLPSSHLKYRASGSDLLEGKPLVVLINKGSASASEIVAGALQDHGRATLLGATSYGKASVQSLMPITDDSAIKLTTAYYYTPNGRSIHNEGITPDITLEKALEESPEFVPGQSDPFVAKAIQILKSDKLHARLKTP